MMRNSYDIARSRQLARMCLRLLVLFYASILVGVVLSDILTGFRDRDVFVSSGAFVNFPFTLTYECAPALAIALMLLLSERRLVAWLVPLPKDDCPACGYSLDQITTPKCPECGLPLTTRWSDAKPDSTTNATPPPP